MHKRTIYFDSFIQNKHLILTFIYFDNIQWKDHRLRVIDIGMLGIFNHGIIHIT